MEVEKNERYNYLDRDNVGFSLAQSFDVEVVQKRGHDEFEREGQEAGRKHFDLVDLDILVD